MEKDGQAAQESVVQQKVDISAVHRGERVLETGRLDGAIKDALEDDEVREALELLHDRAKRP
ncbi:hypothetical protein ABH994_001441 [Bradyrhizobium yuanmingense]|uniref:hypothetical protein n=1 Tax=Bradyrhizobium yuanmingense TaxID=108015 RepID=UPI0035188275